MKVVCRGGWAGNAHPVRVLQEGPEDRVSDGLCPECLDLMRRKLEGHDAVHVRPAAEEGA